MLQVHVRIRNQLAACGGGHGLAEEVASDQYDDVCMFSYSPVATPVVQSINATSAKSGDLIEIRGLGFTQQLNKIFVRFGDTNCLVTFSTREVIQCTLSKCFAGPKPLHLHVSSTGVANTSGIVLDCSLEIDSLLPNQGSTAGGTLVTISGHGFYDSTDGVSVDADDVFQQQVALSVDATPNAEDCHGQWQNVVTLGGTVCEVIQATATSLTVLTPAEMNNESTHDLTVTVLCPDRPEASSSQTFAGGYTFSSALTPNLTGIQPTEGRTQGGDSITIYGSGFSHVTEENTVKV